MDATAIRKEEILTDEQLDEVTGGAPDYVAYFKAAEAAGIDTSKIRVDGILGIQIINPADVKR